jgi:hypothetical protein
MFLSRAIPSTIRNSSGFGIHSPDYSVVYSVFRQQLTTSNQQLVFHQNKKATKLAAHCSRSEDGGG